MCSYDDFVRLQVMKRKNSIYPIEYILLRFNFQYVLDFNGSKLKEKIVKLLNDISALMLV
jgi:hypothetical protein